jgi:hypothetical protein
VARTAFVPLAFEWGEAYVELPEFCGQGLASMRSAGGKRHVLEEGADCAQHEQASELLG